MGGIDKALLSLNGKPMIEWVATRLRPQVGTLLINTSYSALRDYGDELVSDAIADQPGPLAGLHAGLVAARTPLLVCAPCDAPLLPADLVLRLHAALVKDAADVAVARTARGLQPTFLLCRTTLATSIEKFLAGGGHAVHRWLAEQRHIEVMFDDETDFRNINTPQEAEQVAPLLRD